MGCKQSNPPAPDGPKPPPPPAPPSATRRRVKGKIPIGPIAGVEWITYHCAHRFCQRRKHQGTVGGMLIKIEDWLRISRPARPVPGNTAVKKLLNHGMRAATYRMVGKASPKAWVLVILGDTLVTVHQNTAGEFEPISSN